MVLVGTEALQSFFSLGGWFRLKVMTPLLGTNNPSAPVGDKSGGERRAARSLLSCALWSGMGRLWRGMGGMGRPEPLSAHRPHQQQGLSGFHETRDTRHETRLLPSTRRKPARIPRFSRNTAFLPSRQTAHARRRQARRLQGGRYEAVRKRVERSFSESRDRNNDLYRIRIRFTTRYIPQYPAMRRKDSDKPLPPIKCPLALRQPGYRLNLPFSPRGEAKWVRGPSGLGASRAEEKGASRLARAGVLEQYVEHGKQAQRSHGGRMACFDRRVVRNAG